MRPLTVPLLLGSVLSAPALALAADLAPDPRMSRAGTKLLALNAVILLALMVAGVAALLRRRSATKPPGAPPSSAPRPPSKPPDPPPEPRAG